MITNSNVNSFYSFSAVLGKYYFGKPLSRTSKMYFQMHLKRAALFLLCKRILRAPDRSRNRTSRLLSASPKVWVCHEMGV